MDEQCVFCRVANGDIPVAPVYEDEEFLAFPDINPQAPVHVLLIPRTHYRTLLEMEDPAFLGRFVAAAKRAALALNLAHDGFRLVINCGDNGGQTVPHVHWHILGGRFMQWPPG